MNCLFKLTATFLKPKNIAGFCEGLWPFALILGSLMWVVGVIWGFYVPDDYQHGALVKIMFVHIPSSWWALGFYTAMALCSVCGIVFKQQIYFLISKSIAPVGLTLTIISLLTGMLWGKPAWGAWWVWDARLTSMLILALMYVSYINLMSERDSSLYVRAAFIQLLGWLNIPLIKWSVEWWTTLHQPASITLFRSNAIHQTFLWPLVVMVVAVLLIGIAISMMFLLTEIHHIQNDRRGDE